MSSAEPPLLPLIAAQISHLLQDPVLPVKVDQIWSSGSNACYSDRFTLSIPFCLDYVKWDVIYKTLFPSVAPDFVFPPEDEDFDLLSEISDGEAANKSSLCDWSTKDHARLLVLVREIRELYLQYQRNRVAALHDARLFFEISTILPREREEVKFALPLLLDMDINTMVQACPWTRPQKIYLEVIFPVSQCFFAVPSAPRIKLVSTPELRDLFSIEDVKLPPWYMVQYLHFIEDNVKMQVVKANASIGARRRFIEALTPFFGRPVEADLVFCCRATVLSATGGFRFLVHILIPCQFPEQQPILMMQSSEHLGSQGTPILSNWINNYPWSPQWDSPQMAERISEYLAEECLNFKRFCVDPASPQ